MTKRLKQILTMASVVPVGIVIWYVVGFTLPAYTYESSDRGMAEIEIPWKGRDPDVVEAQFEKYKNLKHDPTIRLYRTSKRIWTAPNLWWDNLTNKRWLLPYMEPSQVQKQENT